MLSVVAFAWGVLAFIGMAIGFVPYFRGLHWVNIPFAVAGAILGIVAIFSRRQGGARSAVVGTSLCMLASLIGIMRLAFAEGIG